MNGLCYHTDFIFSVIKLFQFLVGRQFQISETPDRTFHYHQLSALQMQNQQHDNNDNRCNNRTQNAHRMTYGLHVCIDFRRIVTHHKNPVSVF